MKKSMTKDELEESYWVVEGGLSWANLSAVGVKPEVWEALEVLGRALGLDVYED